MADSLPEAWFVGASQTGKRACIEALVEQPLAQGTEATWDITTKYYRARVAVRSVCSGGATPTNTGACEAVVLLIDATREHTFKEAKEWLSKASIDAEIRLLVANKSDLLMSGRSTVLTRPAWLRDAIQWSVDECFEYIETCAARPDLDSKLQLDGEQQGIARVADALKAHMWPGLEMHSSSRKAAAGQSAAASDPLPSNPEQAGMGHVQHLPAEGGYAGQHEWEGSTGMGPSDRGQYEQLPGCDEANGHADDKEVHSSSTAAVSATNGAVSSSGAAACEAAACQTAAVEGTLQPSSHSPGAAAASIAAQSAASEVPEAAGQQRGSSSGTQVPALGGTAVPMPAAARTSAPDTHSSQEKRTASGNGISGKADGGDKTGPGQVHNQPGSNGDVQPQKAKRDDVVSGKDQDSEEEAADLEEFEKLLVELQGARAKLSGLPDHQRRDEASRLALRMAQMLGFSENGSDDE